MVDFKKMKEIRSSTKSIDPIEIFHRLPKGEGINDLWSGQAEALKTWHENRNDRDIIIKLNTGGGKTLVGLLIAQSVANETNGPILYLCPTRQLMNQTYQLGKEYGFRCHTYQRSMIFGNDFLNGEDILIATYAALFNGKSRFGITDREYVDLRGIILDDAHTAFSIIRDQFTISIKRNEIEDLYLDLCNLFRSDFDSIGRIGTFEDIISKKERQSVLEVPYWSWKEKSPVVREKIGQLNDLLEWPLLRDEFDYCHVLINHDSFSITPFFPLIEKIPSFSYCPTNIYVRHFAR